MVCCVLILTSGIAAGELIAAQMDIRINSPLEVPGYAVFTLTSAGYHDALSADSAGFEDTSDGVSPVYSGADTEYLVLYMDIQNLTGAPVEYTSLLNVTVGYRNSSLYGGFVYQCNYDLQGEESYVQALSQRQTYPLKLTANRTIAPNEIGHYVLGCTLPQDVADDRTSSSYVSVKFGAYEIIYPVDAPQEQFTRHLYQQILGREADAAGLEHYVRSIASGQQTCAQACMSLFQSPEFSNAWHSNEVFLQIAYRACMGREADADGMAYWLDTLNSGVSRSDVLSILTASDEFNAMLQGFGLQK